MAVGRTGLDRLNINLPPRHGKLCADHTPVLTTCGWKTHGELQVGDEVFSPSGRPIRVLAVSEPAPADVRVEFGNGAVIYCHENHEWTLYDRSRQQERTLETGSFLKINRLRKPPVILSGRRCIYQLPEVKPIQFPEAELPMPPYALGAWLGDGTTSKPFITGDKRDGAVIEAVKQCGYVVSVVHTHPTTGVLTTSFGGPKKGRPRGNSGKFSSDLISAGVLNNKHIPECYKRSSVSQRLKLMAGLIDTDGHVDENSRVRIVTVSLTLAKDIHEVAASLGWRPYIMSQEPHLSTSGIQGRQTVYSVGFQPTCDIPVQLERKRIKRVAPQRAIGLVSVRYDPQGYVGRCIQVDSQDGLYLVGRELIPTHNSLLISQFFPAWFLLVYPQRRVILCSYEADFASQWGRKVRDLVIQWGPMFGVTVAQDSKAADRWEIKKHGGGMQTAGVGGPLLGKGADLLILDDVTKNAEEAMSPTHRSKLWEWYTSTAYTRLEPGGAVVNVQQRWHTQDMTGKLRESDPTRWKELILPALAKEGDILGREPGAALWPERYDAVELESKRRLAPTWFAAQYQQEPMDLTGGFFRGLERIPIVAAAPTADQFVRMVRSWDLAATEAQAGTDPDWTVGAKIGKHKDGTFWVLDVQRNRLGPQGVRDLIRQTAQADGAKTVILVEREGGASGKIAAQSIVADLAGYTARAVRPEGSKAERAEPWGAQIEAGNVRMVKAEWNRALLEEHQSFPTGAHDDIVDGCSGAFRDLARGEAFIVV